MRYAILSDVHANLAALDRVLAVAKSLHLDRVISLGDLVGFHSRPNDCVARLQAHGAVCVQGNHDIVALGRAEPERFGERARAAILWTRERLTPESRLYLESLPERAVVDEAFVICHGSLRSPHEYVKTPEAIEQMFGDLAREYPAHRLCFYGHTHRPVIHVSGSPDGQSPPGRLKIHPDRVYLVNPGSVGEPRDGDWRASFVLYDSDAGEIAFHRVRYNAAATLWRTRVSGIPVPRRRLLAESIRALIPKGT